MSARTVKEAILKAYRPSQVLDLIKDISTYFDIFGLSISRDPISQGDISKVMIVLMFKYEIILYNNGESMEREVCTIELSFPSI